MTIKEFAAHPTTSRIVPVGPHIKGLMVIDDEDIIKVFFSRVRILW